MLGQLFVQGARAMCSRGLYSQLFPPSPCFTDKDVESGSLKGKVVIVTGGTSGLGLELIRCICTTGATIYMAGRSSDKAELAIKQIEAEHKAAIGDAVASKIKFLYIDFNDLNIVRSSAAAFAAQEDRLDILWNNAGVANVPRGTKTMQQIEAHLGINCVAPLLFAHELLPQLKTAASSSALGSVRVVWTTSVSAEVAAPVGGVDFHVFDQHTTRNPFVEYGMSKLGNWLFALEGARRWQSFGIISVAENPGQLDTDIWKSVSSLILPLVRATLYDKRFGAYTMLYAGLSNEVNIESNGAYIMPWGRNRALDEFPRADVVAAIRNEHLAERFWDRCVQAYTDCA